MFDVSVLLRHTVDNIFHLSAGSSFDDGKELQVEAAWASASAHEKLHQVIPLLSLPNTAITFCYATCHMFAGLSHESLLREMGAAPVALMPPYMACENQRPPPVLRQSTNRLDTCQ